MHPEPSPVSPGTGWCADENRINDLTLPEKAVRCQLYYCAKALSEKRQNKKKELNFI